MLGGSVSKKVVRVDSGIKGQEAIESDTRKLNRGGSGDLKNDIRVDDKFDDLDLVLVVSLTSSSSSPSTGGKTSKSIPSAGNGKLSIPVNPTSSSLNPFPSRPIRVIQSTQSDPYKPLPLRSSFSKLPPTLPNKAPAST